MRCRHCRCVCAPSAEVEHLARLLATRLERMSRGFDAGCGLKPYVRVQSTADVITPQAPLTLGHKAFKAPPVAVLTSLFDRLAAFGAASCRASCCACVTYPSGRLSARHAAPLSGEADDAGLSTTTAPEPQTRPLFMLCAPEPIEVIAEIPRVHPTDFVGGVCCTKGLRTRARTHQPEWWPSGRRHNSLTRDYFRVEDRNGCRFWIYRDGLYGRKPDVCAGLCTGCFRE